MTDPVPRDRIAPIKLTEAGIASAAPGPEGKGPRIYRFENGNGLALRVMPNGRKFFIYCFTSDEADANGKRKQERVATGIEWLPRSGRIEEANQWMKKAKKATPENRRKRASRARAEQQVAAKEVTVAKLIARYITEHAKPNKRSWKEDQALLNTHVQPAWGERKAKTITRADVDALVTPIALGDEDAGVAPRKAAANHLLAVVRKMFSFAVDKGVIENHPCLRMKAPGGKIEPRRRAPSTAKELRLLWRITDRDGPWARSRPEKWPKDVGWQQRGRLRPDVADAIRLVLGTAVRANEAAEAPWSEFDLDEAIWIIDGKRTKNGRTHLVPLLQEVVEMLRRRRTEVVGDYVFPGVREDTAHINDKNLSQAIGFACSRLARIGLQPFVTHDLRRTVETGMAAAKVPKEYRDAVLNHTDASVGGKHYNLHDYADEKREALEKWARRLEGMLKPERDNVVQIRRGRV